MEKLGDRDIDSNPASRGVRDHAVDRLAVLLKAIDRQSFRLRISPSVDVSHLIRPT